MSASLRCRWRNRAGARTGAGRAGGEGRKGGGGVGAPVLGAVVEVVLRVVAVEPGLGEVGRWLVEEAREGAAAWPDAAVAAVATEAAAVGWEKGAIDVRAI